MTRNRLAGAILVLSTLFAPGLASAAMSPLAFSIVPPVQFPAKDFSVTGLRASALWGNHKNVYGLDLGLIGNMTEGQMTGISASGIFNLNKGQTTAVLLQAAGVANINVAKARVVGVQLAGIINRNRAESSVFGLQVAPVNLAEFTTINGFQVGIYNRARQVNGFQIGLINVADSVRGLQIGLINVHKQGLFAVAPILNFGF